MGDFQFVIGSLELEPRSSALMVVDMENEFCRADGRAYLGPRAVAAVQRARMMIERCRELSIRIIFVRSIREPDAMEFRGFGQEPFLLRGTEGVEFAAGILRNQPNPSLTNTVTIRSITRIWRRRLTGWRSSLATRP